MVTFVGVVARVFDITKKSDEGCRLKHRLSLNGLNVPISKALWQCKTIGGMGFFLNANDYHGVLALSPTLLRSFYTSV